MNIRLLRVLGLIGVALIFLTGCHAEGDCSTGEGECTNPDAVEVEDPTCPSRKHVIKCAEQYLDTNRNGKLDRDELEGAINKLPWYSKGTFSESKFVPFRLIRC